jgi:predicted CXXCH cytochrome family protein
MSQKKPRKRVRRSNPASPAVEISAARPRRAGTWLAVGTGGFLIIAAAWFFWPDKIALLTGAAKTPVVAAHYVGAQACAGCHESQYAAWQGSQHQAAMQEATDRSVLGNFNSAKFNYAGVASTFFKRYGKFFVNTDGPDGRVGDYEIKFTFGVAPLQQYLIAFPDGRLQGLTIAWDARPKQEGGQRWFHLYPDERITHDDELHWTRAAQNWNFMCADCHSTDVRKNYDAATNKFETQWSEINVGCEACHGPGAHHLAWAKSQSPPFSKGEASLKGLAVQLTERRGVVWLPNPTNGNSTRSTPRASEREIEVCAQCHARRGQLAEGYQAGKPFLDYYRPALLTSPLYYPDGQQRGEVYIWGSFLQSKMYANGVTCSDCHEPHSGKLRAQGNTLCATCHAPAKYDSAAHHHHTPASAGAACVACHMPKTTYMGVDPRADHSLRFPRPDQSVKFATPNACIGCHKNRDPSWAAAQVNAWYGHEPQGYQRFAAAFAGADAGALDAAGQLRAIAEDSTEPAIVRASALTRFSAASDPSTGNVIEKNLGDAHGLVRLGALQALARGAGGDRLTLAAPLLSDPLRALRIEAATILSAVPAAQMSAPQRAAFERAASEYVDSQRYNADRAEARVNLGTFYANQGDAAKAEDEIKAAIRLEPWFIPAYVNLADLYRARGRDGDGERILRQGLKIAPRSALLHYALGLGLVRLKRADDALVEFERASALEPGNGRFAYVHAVALHSSGKVAAAIAKLETALAAHPDDRDILAALASFNQGRGDNAQAEKYAARLRALSTPRNP